MPWARAILHVDMDAFYASVEQRDRPELLGKAVIVGGNGRRGVVSAASYEARRFGVKSAMPMFAAMKLCPHAVAVPPRMSRYVEVSKSVMAIFGRFSPSVEPLSLDEAFVDVTGTEALFGSPVECGWKVQHAVREELRLSCSVGVAANKYVAKVASDLKKPAGLVVVPPGEERAFLEPLALERLWGVGPKTAERLHALGLVTIGDVARASASALTGATGDAVGTHIGALARGEDERPVDVDRAEKSIGAERTLEQDIEGAAAVRRELLGLVDEIASQLRARKLRASGVRLKLKYADFHRVTRELTLPEPVLDAQSIINALDALIPRVDVDRRIRLVGLACTALVDEAAPRQPSLFGAVAGDHARGAEASTTPTEKAERLGRALDAIHGKYGDEALKRGVRTAAGSAPGSRGTRPAASTVHGARTTVVDESDAESGAGDDADAARPNDAPRAHHRDAAHRSDAARAHDGDTARRSDAARAYDGDAAHRSDAAGAHDVDDAGHRSDATREHDARVTKRKSEPATARRRTP